MSVTVVVGAQFGDEGKGKIVDALVKKNGVRLVIRYNGGANAGHTVVIDDQTFKLHQVPSGIFHPGVTCAIGNGAVVDPIQLSNELNELQRRGVSTNNFFVSHRAHVVMPWHPLLDLAAEERRVEKIGTTGRGIGPCYEDKAARRGIRVGDLLDQATLRAKVQELWELKRSDLRDFPELLARLPSAEQILGNMALCAGQINPRVWDVDEMTRLRWRAGECILLEGAQGTLLDLELGTYPNVSSSLATSAGACVGSGLPPKAISKVICVAKAYTTRVGNGPFRTEQDNEIGERLRQQGQEFGTTTGRARRCGWFDAYMVKRSCEINGADGIVLTKLDVLTGFDPIRVAPHFIKYEPIDYYDCLPGWTESINDVTRWDDLHENARDYVKYLEQACGTDIIAVATGPSRDAVIWR